MPPQLPPPLEWWLFLPVTSYPVAFGLLLFALTWLLPRPWLDFGGAGGRAVVLRRAGSICAGSILAVALVAQAALVLVPGLWTDAGWWLRPLPLVLTLLSIVALGITLARTPRPASLAIAPRRSWHAFAPRLALWAGAATSALILAASVWQGLVPRRTPTLPELGGNQGVFNMGGSAISPPWAFGWAGNAPTILALLALLAVCVGVLAADANRPIGGSPSPSLARAAAARLVCAVALAGLVLALGTVWSQVWAPPTWAVFMEDPQMGRGTFIGSDYRGLVDVATAAGRALQALGLALLARLAIDSWRAGRRVADADPARHEPEAAR